MKIEILGSGGATPPPKPGCGCRVCREARSKGLPYYRTGPSCYLHDVHVLFDTPEESKYQLNRSGIEQVDACFYSHWHPDHTLGSRVFESLHADFRSSPGTTGATDIYLPPQVAEDFESFLGLGAKFEYMSDRGWTRMHRLAPGAMVAFEDVTILPFPLAASYVYAFLIEQEDKRLLLAPDELVGWDPPDFLLGIDVAILPMGILEFDPFSGKRTIPEGHSILSMEATIRQTITMIEKMRAQRVILTHIEEFDRVGYDDLEKLSRTLQEQGLPVSFAWDTQIIEL